MNTPQRILRASIATLTAVVLTSPVLRAATLDNFTLGEPTNTPATATKIGAGGPGPLVVTEDTNSFLRLLDGVNDENNQYSYDATDPGAFDTVNAKFDFRIQFGTNGLADGMSLLLLPTSIYGPSGLGPTPTAEEPNVVGAFGLGVDVYPGINNISTHWNNFQVNEINPNPWVSFRDNNVFNRVEVVLQRIGNATNATVTITGDVLGTLGEPGTPTKIMETVMPNMLPYESRVQLGGRTGGENMRLDVDNVNVTYANPFLAEQLPIAPVGHLFQDFDSIGTTNYRAVQAAQSVAGIFRPGPLMKAAEAGTDGAFMRIVNDAVEGQNNRIVFDRALDSGASTLPEVLEFDVRFNSGDQPADGLGLLFLPTVDPITGAAALTGDGIASSEEPNHAGMLGIGFDVYPNGGTDIAPGVSLHFNNMKIVDVAAPLALGQFHKVQVLREPVEGGLNVTVKAFPDVNGAATEPVTLIDKQFVAGAQNYDYRVQLSGRTGGANADHDIDNVMSYQLPGVATANTRANFSLSAESPWKAYAIRAGAPPQVRTDAIPSPSGAHLRLIHDNVNDQLNAIAFDKQVDGTVAGKTGITADFEFRVTSADITPADGFSLMLIPVATYGNTGPGAAVSTGGFVAEEPNVPGTFGVGFDLYDGGREFNEVSAHWDGFTLQSRELLDDVAMNFDAGLFHKAHFELRQSGADMLLDLILTPNNFGQPGAPLVIFDDLLVPGMALYDYRVEFAGRSGGLNMSVDLDNILVQTVPEPGSAMLLALGGVAVSCFRRRRPARS